MATDAMGVGWCILKKIRTQCRGSRLQRVDTPTSSYRRFKRRGSAAVNKLEDCCEDTIFFLLSFVYILLKIVLVMVIGYSYCYGNLY